MKPRTLLVVAYAFLATAWVFTNPVGSAPDERAHFIKAVGVAYGQPAGAARPVTGDRPWIDGAIREFDIPREMRPAGWACNSFKPDVPFECDVHVPKPGKTITIGTPAGSYQPYPYVLPGLAARLAGDAVRGLYAARVLEALVTLAMIAGSLWLLDRGPGGAARICGALVAITPMVLHIGTTVQPNGTETVGALCFWCGLIRLSDEGEAPWAVWLLTAAAGMTLALSRPLGPLWIALLSGLVVVHVGFRTTISVLRSSRGRAATSIGLVAAAVAAGVAWELRVQPHPPFNVAAAIRGIKPALAGLPGMYYQWLGIFGWLDTHLPGGVHVGWGVLAGALGLAALLRGPRRERIVLVLIGGAVVAMHVFMAAAILAPSGFGMQGRYLLPIVVALPVYAGAVLAKRGTARWVPVAAVAVAAMQAVAWYTNARRYAVGAKGPIWFPGRSLYSPPLGHWWPWLILVAVAAAAMGLWGLTAVRTRTEPAAVRG